MATYNVELRRKGAAVGSSFDDKYLMATHVDIVEGLMTDTLANGGKIKDNVLPNWIFGGMRYAGSYVISMGAVTTAALLTSVQNYKTTHGGVETGIYYNILDGGDVTVSTGHLLRFEGGSKAAGQSATVQHGDWIVYDGINEGSLHQFSVVNNVYDIASGSAPGLMSAAMFSKLAGIAAGAEVNTVTSVNTKTGPVVITKGDVGLANVVNADTTNATNINSGTLSADRLASSGVGAGTYKSVTVDTKGRVTAGTNPTTLAGYGITDAQAYDGDLAAIAALTGTTGLLRKTAANTWSLDTAAYLTAITKAMIEAQLTGEISTHTHPIASTTARGTIELATQAEAEAVTSPSTSLAITPATLQNAGVFFGGSWIPFFGSLSNANSGTSSFAPYSFAVVQV